MTQLDSPPHQNTAFPVPYQSSRFLLNGDGLLRPLDRDRDSYNNSAVALSSDVRLMPIHTNIMRASGLLHGRMAIIDRARKPKLNDLLAVRFNGDVIMRRLERHDDLYCFVADDPREPIYYVTKDTKVECLGVIVDTMDDPRH